MNTITYVNEHVWIHFAGHFLVFLAVFSALYNLIAFTLSFRLHRYNWGKSIAWSFWVHFLSIIAMIGLILFMMSQRYYEFEYVWAHVSDDLPVKYILSAFWEGQEGSFLLWLFWNIVLGIYFIVKRDPFSQTIIAVILSINLILCSMLLGIYFGDVKLGSSPFQLLRHTMDIPLFNNADYTSLIKGNGLNPLLQNYWMLIHPPTLFLGFASTLIPFAYAFAILLNGYHESHFRKALVWACFSAAVLGTGIIMGGAWAYEALSFGGYWAWDPVENMSLAPWLILVAGIHTNLIANATGHSIRPTLLLYFLSFIVVCYSSFLTRSGILGDSSAHAFTQMGLEWQLVFLCVVVSIVPIVLVAKNRVPFPTPSQEERMDSKEFWMFIGSLILLFSAVLISFTTSIPVYNKLLDFIGQITGNSFQHLHRSMPLDPVAHHNQFQIWIAILIALISGFAMLLRYKKTEWSKLPTLHRRALILVPPISLAMGSAVAMWCFNQLHWSHTILLISSWFTIVSSLTYLVLGFYMYPKTYASAIAHGGFGILLLGILFTGINKRILSSMSDTSGLSNTQPSPSKHLNLIRNIPLLSGDYQVVFQSDTMIKSIRHYALQFKEINHAGDTNVFMLTPQIQYDNKLTKVAASNPSIKRFVHKDIFTLIAQIPPSQVDAKASKAAEDSLIFNRHLLGHGDTLNTEKFSYSITNFQYDFKPNNFDILEHDQMLQLTVDVYNKQERIHYTATPAILFRKNLIYKFPYHIEECGIRITLPDTSYSSFVPEYNSLKLQKFSLKIGENRILDNGLEVLLSGIDRSVPEEVIETSDAEIGVTAILKIIKGSIHYSLNVYFLIKENQIISYPETSMQAGLSIRFTGIDPQSETMHFEYGVLPGAEQQKVFLDIAENGPKTNYIVIQIIEFPWINLVWLGSMMMMIGLSLSVWCNKKFL